jgi:aryl-alcohol dehydrogenase-like predicted oxidoreductase
MVTRQLGNSRIEVSGLGLGCWAIGGPFDFGGKPAGWGGIRDDDSIRAIARAIAKGVTFFDTANVYGCGHSEEILGKALAGKRPGLVIATKFGNKWEPGTMEAYSPERITPREVREQLEASLRRLGTDYVDLYQFHKWDYPHDRAIEIRDTLEQLVGEGKIRGYGWSTDRVGNARLFAEGRHCIAVQQQLNLFGGNPAGEPDEILALCEERNLASIDRAPLAMGILSGKFTPETTFPADDVRSKVDWFEGFKSGKPDPEWLKRLDAVREILTSGGRTLVQGALSWLWGRSEKTVPIPGFKTAAQVEENAGALEYGPLSSEQMNQIEEALEG